MQDKLITIKVLETTKQDLNVIAAITGKKQYEAAAKLATKERLRLEKRKNKLHPAKLIIQS